MHRRNTLLARSIVPLIIAAMAILSASAATAPPSTPEAAAPQSAGPAQKSPAAPPAPADPDASAGDTPAMPDAAGIISFLNDTITWSQQQEAEAQLVSEVSDQVLLNENRQNADQIVRLSFDFARAAAPAIGQNSAPAPDDANGRRGATYGRMQGRLDLELKQTQTELADVREKTGGATGARRTKLTAQANELTGELELLDARRDALRSLSQLSGTGKNGQGGSLASQIEALAATTAATSTETAKPAVTTAAAAAPPISTAAKVAATANLASLWERGELAVRLARNADRLESRIADTRALAESTRALSAAFIAQIRALSAQGDQIADEADTADAAKLAEERKQLDAITAQFRRTQAIVKPLSDARALLRLYQTGLAGWRDEVRDNYHGALRSLAVRVAMLALILAAVGVAGSLWKRAVNKYVHDVQRRYQFLFLRRMVMWVLIALIVAFSFAGQLGSFATFAGLMTAGVAVALQNVILSVVGYFFLIGKYGIRVGDRVQIGGVTGQVLDIGLVRLHLLEFGGGADSPTGRVVAFSNSMVFQSTAGLYKYMPDIQLSWHELTMMLAADTDLGSARSRLQRAAEGALKEFHPVLEKEAQRLEASVGLSQHHTLQPTLRLRVQAGGLEVTIYYPVDVEHGAEIDEKVATAIRQALEREPPLPMAGAVGTGLRLKTST